jgi:VIT1/CCC1 family predicted Fe2+/Mn2+ transporter
MSARQHHFHTKVDPHRQGEGLSDVILGGQDGLVNTLGVILGIAAATGDPRVVLAGGLAATMAEAVAMGGVAYTSLQAERAYYEAERAREHRHIDNAPEVERNELVQIYADKGFEGKLLDRIVNKICEDREVWINVMMAEEHGLAPIPKYKPLKNALLVFSAALIGSLIPLTPFFFLGTGIGMLVAIVVSIAALFGVGVYKARVMVGHPGRSGLEMAAIGIACAMVGYAVGWLFKVPPG